MTQHDNQDDAIYQIEGPAHKGNFWISSITLKERVSETFQGETREEVQENMLQYLGQQALEIEKVRILLRKMFESQPDSQGRV